MPKQACSERIRIALNQSGMTQTELSRKTGIPKSAISQYIKGSFEPKQDRIYSISKALNVSEAWLMGFDVPKERKDTSMQAEKDFDFFYKYSMLDDRDKKIILSMIDSMLSSNGSGV